MSAVYWYLVWAWPLALAPKPPTAAPELLAYGTRDGLQPPALRLHPLCCLPAWAPASAHLTLCPYALALLLPARFPFLLSPRQLLQRHGFSLWGAACELPQGAGQAANSNSGGASSASNGGGNGTGGGVVVCERVTAATALLHGMALAGSAGEREAAGERRGRWGWWGWWGRGPGCGHA